MSKRFFAMQWHITDACDQRCQHCYIYHGKDKITNDDFDLSTLILILDNFVESCQKLNVEPIIVLTGGDPILYKDFWKLLEAIKHHHLKFSILGNPFNLNYDIVHCLENFGCISYQLSLDGLQSTHDSIRRCGSFEATLNSLKYFEHSSIKTAIMSTVSTTNILELPELVDVIVEYKVNRFGFARYCPTDNDYNLIVSAEDYHCLLDKMWHKFAKYSQSATHFILKDHLWTLYLYEKGLFNPFKISNPKNLILDGCHCGINHITTLSNGTVYACRRCESPVGKVPTQSFYDIFLSTAMDAYRKYDSFEKCKDCELKNFCRGCPSVAKCLTGNFYGKDPQCWKK